MRTCRFCGKTFEPTTRSQVYCSVRCRKRAWEHRQAIEYRNTLGISKPDPAERCPDDCRYLNMNGIRTCHYIIIEGEPRGCKGGRDCERYKV